jgi:hypothetical protein
MKWTPEKIAILRERYPIEGSARLAKTLGCSRTAVIQKAYSLDITCRVNARRGRGRWTSEMIAQLRGRYSIEGPSQLGAAWGLSRTAVQNKARKLGLVYGGKWTDEMVALLRQRYPIEGSARLATALGCSRRAVIAKAFTLGIQRSGRWTAESIEILCSRYPTEGAKQIAAEQRITLRAVYSAAHIRGVKCTRERLVEARRPSAETQERARESQKVQRARRRAAERRALEVCLNHFIEEENEHEENNRPADECRAGR